MARTAALLSAFLSLAAPAFSEPPAASIHALSALLAAHCSVESPSVRSNAFPMPAAKSSLRFRSKPRNPSGWDR